MPSTYSTLKLQLMATGENNTSWGDVTNVNLGTALEEAIAGSANVVFASADVTLSLVDTNTTQVARNMRLNLTGTTGGATRNLFIPAIEKMYLVTNNCTDAVIVRTAAVVGATLPAGMSGAVFCDGNGVFFSVNYAPVFQVGNAIAGTALANGDAVISGRLGIGTSALTPCALRINKNITGATISYGAVVDGSVQSDVTSIALGYTSTFGTAAAAFTLAELRHYYAGQGVVGAGSAVTNQTGFQADPLTAGVSNVGFRAINAAAVGVGKVNTSFYTDQNVATGGGTTYSFYAAGTAPSIFNGPVAINGTLNLGGNILTGQGVSTGGAVIELGQLRTGDGLAYMDFHSSAGSDFDGRILRNAGVNGNFDILNGGSGLLSFGAGGAGRMWLTAAGRLGIGTAGPAATLHSNVGDGGLVFGVSGNTKGMRMSTSAAETVMEGVDSTLVNSYQPLGLNGSTLRLGIPGVNSNAVFVSSAGNVGIGTGGPTTRLHVAGNILGGDFTADRGNGTGVIFLGTTGHYVTWDGANYIMPGGGLYVNGQPVLTNATTGVFLSSAQNAFINDAGGNARFYFAGGGPTYHVSPTTHQFRVNGPSGPDAVTIDTGQSMSVAGNISTGNGVYAGYLTSSGNVNAANTVTTVHLTATGNINATSGTVTAINIQANGQVNANGAIIAGANIHSGGVIYPGNEGNYYLNYAGGNPLINWDSSDYMQFLRGADTYNFIIAGAAKFAINPGGAISTGDMGVYGNVNANGNVGAFSDAKLKTNLEPITDALTKVGFLTGYTYDRIDRPTEGRHAGLIAQDVQQVLPEVVGEVDGTLTLAYGNMIALLVEAIKELRDEVAFLKGQVA